MWFGIILLLIIACIVFFVLFIVYYDKYNACKKAELLRDIEPTRTQQV